MPLILIGLAMEVTLLVAAAYQPPAFLPAYFFAFLLYCVAIFYTERSRGNGACIFAFALLFRVSLLLFPPFLSDDVYRYLWDGRVQRHGINPYRFPPDAPELAALRDTRWALINNNDIPTIYPPLAQLVFRAAVTVGNTPIVLKAVMTLFDLLCLLILHTLLGSRQGNHALVYAWHPLVLFEVSSSGHCDAIAMLFLLVGTAIIIRSEAAKSSYLDHSAETQQGRSREAKASTLIGGLAMGALSAAFMVKLFPVLFFPFFAKRTRFRSWFWFLPLPLLLSAIYIRPDSGIFRSLHEYLTRWRFNDSVFWLIQSAVGDPDRARHICAAAVVFGTLWAATRKWRIDDQIFWALGFLILFSPQLDPWRLMWVVPFLALRMRLSWLILTGTIALSYHPYIVQGPGKDWVEYPLFKVLEFIPFFAVGAVEIARSLRNRSSAAASK